MVRGPLSVATDNGQLTLPSGFHEAPSFPARALTPARYALRMRRVTGKLSRPSHGGMAMTPMDGTGNRLDDLLSREWLTTNHLGGYASSTIPGLNTRKYHGLLVAAIAPPVHRMVLLSRGEEAIHCDGW